MVVVKARNLRPENDAKENRNDAPSDIQNVFVKVNSILSCVSFF